MFKEKGNVLNLIYNMLEQEKLHLKGSKELSQEHQSYTDKMNHEIEECNKDIQILKDQRDKIKEESNNVLSH